MSNSVAASDQAVGVILAGGEARRMNYRDKGLIEFGQYAMVQRVLKRLQPQVSDIVVVANRNVEHYQRFGVPVISDWDDDTLTSHAPRYQGPLRGISRALRYYQNTSPLPKWLLLAPCDAPNYPLDLMHRYQEHLSTMTAASQCLVPFDGDRLQPLFALLHFSVHQSIEVALSQRDFSVTHWLSRVNYQQISMPAEFFRNINYPDQLKE